MEALFGAYGLIVLAVYFIPAIIAMARGHRQSGAILVINLILGWTFLGWIAALVWAFVDNNAAPTDATSKPAEPIPESLGSDNADKVYREDAEDGTYTIRSLSYGGCWVAFTGSDGRTTAPQYAGRLEIAKRKARDAHSTVGEAATA
mgnify:CR=1 FL=1